MSKGVNVNQTSGSYEYIFCHYWYFLLEINLKFDPEVCSECHHLRKAMSFNDIGIISVKGNDYRIQFLYEHK